MSSSRRSKARNSAAKAMKVPVFTWTSRRRGRRVSVQGLGCGPSASRCSAAPACCSPRSGVCRTRGCTGPLWSQPCFSFSPIFCLMGLAIGHFCASANSLLWVTMWFLDRERVCAQTSARELWCEVLQDPDWVWLFLLSQRPPGTPDT